MSLSDLPHCFIRYDLVGCWPSISIRKIITFLNCLNSFDCADTTRSGEVSFVNQVG